MLETSNPLFADVTRNQRLLVEGLVLAAALVLGALALKWLDNWRRRMTEAPPPSDSLAAYKISYERGELSEDEYRRIRARLLARNRPPEPETDLEPLPDNEPPLNSNAG